MLELANTPYQQYRVSSGPIWINGSIDKTNRLDSIAMGVTACTL
jgi:hypothetical protein